MDKQKLQDFYCKVNSRLTDEFNLGAIGKDYLTKLYDMDKYVVGCVNLFKVFPPVKYEGSVVKDDLVVDAFLECLEAEGISTSKDYETYQSLLKERAFQYVQDIANMEGDVFTPFRKSILNMARGIYYDNIKYFAIKEGLPEEVEDAFITQLDDIKVAGFVDINGKDDFSVEGLKAGLHNLHQDVEIQADILSDLSLIMSNSRPVETQKIEWFDNKLEENFAMEEFIFSDGGFETKWIECEAVRVRAVYENVTNVVASTILKSKLAAPSLS
jgi:hypothetical protein